MPFVLIIIGAVMVVSAVRDTSEDLVTLVKGDMTGQKSYLAWMISILVIGAIGYIPSMEKLSRYILVLVVIVLILSNKGLFAKFNSQFFGTKAASKKPV